MNLSVILCLKLIIFYEINVCFALSDAFEVNYNQRDVLIKEETEVRSDWKTNGLESRSVGLIDFVWSAISKAKWNVLAMRLTKVFFTFFLDLFLAQYFDSSSATVPQI